jgi:hypothetical protein
VCTESDAATTAHTFRSGSPHENMQVPLLQPLSAINSSYTYQNKTKIEKKSSDSEVSAL